MLQLLYQCLAQRAQMSEVVRLGQPHETDACGILVWAQSEGDIWWPAEALDPFHMPPGKSLPADALAGAVTASSHVPDTFFGIGKLTGCKRTALTTISL